MSGESSRGSKATRAISKLRSIFASANSCMSHSFHVTGTLFGHPYGDVRIVFQEDPRSSPDSLIELGLQTAVLADAMTLGPLRFELECEKTAGVRPVLPLMDEPQWRVQCNGERSRDAVRRECTAADLNVLRALEEVAVGVGRVRVEDGGTEEEVMYVRARFEREVRSRHSEMYRMVNPDGENNGLGLSLSFLRA